MRKFKSNNKKKPGPEESVLPILLVLVQPILMLVLVLPVLILPILVLLLILVLACRSFLGDPVPARGQVKNHLS
jgi:hypothetical protein